MTENEEPKKKPRQFTTEMNQKIRQLFKALVTESRLRYMSADEIHQRCSEIKAVTQRQLAKCDDCKGPLMARERLKACPHCGFTGNWRTYEEERERKLNRELNKELKEARAYERERRAKGYVFK